ncbi:osteopetrosis-associated transmembrane protein 1 [Discoglossus pictus]
MMFACRQLVLGLFVCMGSGSADLSHSPWAEDLSFSLFPSFSLVTGLSLDPSICSQLLIDFANASAALTGCLVHRARPVRLCQGCYLEYVRVGAIMESIKHPVQNQTENCVKSLLQADRVQVLVVLNNFFEETWSTSKCTQCLEQNSTALLNSTIQFMSLFDEVNQCFEKHMQEPSIQTQQGNYSRVCANCSMSYSKLNALYSKLHEAKELCIDLEDAMNSTRILWSKTFNCTLPCTDTVPVIAVSAFIIFLPIVFYLSSFLHSEQRKRKLIFPNRIRTAASGVHIQDKNN